MKYIASMLLMVSVLCGVVFADGVPPLINYQGEVKDDAGNPLATGFHNIDFRIYNADTGGTLLWGTQYNLYVMNGYFNVILGQGGTPVTTPAVPAMTDLMDVFKSYNGDNGDPRYVSLAVDGGAEFSPRQRLLSAPYAVRADTARFADTALNASNAATATHATRADTAGSADSATAASTANQAGNADKLDNQDSTYFARQNQFADAEAGYTGNWRAQFWDYNARKMNDGPLYWHKPVLGVGGQPGNDANTGLRMMKGSIRPLFGEGWGNGIIFQNENEENTHWMFQKDNGTAKELYLTSHGSGDSYITLYANKGVTMRGGSSASLQGDSKVVLNGGTQIEMQTPLIVSSALKNGAQLKWATISDPTQHGTEAVFTAEGDGLFILNAGQCEWTMTVPEHADQGSGTGSRSFDLKFCHNGVDQTIAHSFVYPVKKGMTIKSHSKDHWGNYWWQSWVIYFN